MDSLESIIFDDGEFQAGMARKTLAYLSSRQTTGYTTGGLYYAFHRADDERGLVTIVHGFSEGMYKYRELIYIMLRLGYSTLCYEHRGHGRSIRTTESGSAVHIDSFDIYVDDLDSVTLEVVRRFAGGCPCHLFAHSMGGCVAALYAETHSEEYSKLVLSSPMLGLRLNPVAGLLAPTAVHMLCLAGKGEDTFPVFGKDEKFQNSPSTSLERWQYFKSVRDGNVLLRQTNPTYGWIDSALRASKKAVADSPRIDIPCLLLMAEDDSLVDNSRSEAFAKGNSLVRPVMVAGTKHEIMSSPKSVLLEYYKLIDGFLSEE